MKLGQYFKLVRSLPPDQVLQKGAAKIGRVVRHGWQKRAARLLGTQISDSQLRSALRPDLGDAGGLLAYLRSDRAPAFFVSPERAEAMTAALRRHYPQAPALIVAAADAACAHRFDLLGSGPVALGDSIDWHVDFKNGHRYDPDAYYADVKPAPPPGGHDIKVPWELSRCQHFAWLGQAFWLTGDGRYAQAFVSQVSGWIESNPAQFGVNWACAMDVAIRAVNWLWGYHYLKGAPALTDDFLLKFNKSLLAHGRHVFHNLERSAHLTANHYLADVAGLVYLGLLCPQFEEARRWRDFGLVALWGEMLKQVYDDGVDFEASVSYHRLAAELFLSPILLCRLHGVDVPGAVLARLEKMLEFVLHYTKPDGTVPLLGDGDNGRLHRLKVWAEPEREWLDHRYLLGVGALLFGRDDFGRGAGDQWEEALWLLGEDAVRFKGRLESPAGGPAGPASRAFTKGGIYLMRGRDAYVAIDAGPNGQNGEGGHAHNDTLSFEFFALGQSWVIDPGTYVYTADYGARYDDRCSRSHNLVQIDGQEINRIDPALPFSLADDARPVVHTWAVSGERDLLVAGHSGYERLRPPAFCRRSLLLDKRGNVLLVCDEIESAGRHTFAAHFHLGPSAVRLEGDRAWVEAPAGGARLAFCVLDAPRHATLQCLSGRVSSSYGRQTQAPVLRVEGEFQDHLLLRCLLIPYRGPAAPDIAATAAGLGVARPG